MVCAMRVTGGFLLSTPKGRLAQTSVPLRILAVWRVATRRVWQKKRPAGTGQFFVSNVERIGTPTSDNLHRKHNPSECSHSTVFHTWLRSVRGHRKELPCATPIGDSQLDSRSMWSPASPLRSSAKHSTAASGEVGSGNRPGPPRRCAPRALRQRPTPAHHASKQCVSKRHQRYDNQRGSERRIARANNEPANK